MSQEEELSVKLDKLLDKSQALAHRLALIEALEPAMYDQRLSLLISQSPLAYIVWDREFRVIEWNPAAERIFGWTAAEAAGQHASFIIPESQKEHVDEIWQALLSQTGGERSTNENVTKDGRHIFTEWYNLPILDAEGNLSCVASLCQDDTDRKLAELESLELSGNLEKRVKERGRELDQARDELEELCYAISHDLRSPLRSIHGFSKALESDYGDVLDESAMQYLHKIQHASIRLGDLLDGLLSMVRVNRVEASIEPISISEVVEDLAQDLRLANPDHPVQLSIQPGMTATGDARLVRLLFTNLLSNAWKFTVGKQNPKVDVSCQNDTFCIRDNGVGFNMQYSDKLYKPFQKVHAPNQFPGTGIGLAIAHRIVTRHGGTLWAEGREGEGAAFFFKLSR